MVCAIDWGKKGASAVAVSSMFSGIMKTCYICIAFGLLTFSYGVRGYWVNGVRAYCVKAFEPTESAPMIQSISIPDVLTPFYFCFPGSLTVLQGDLQERSESTGGGWVCTDKMYMQSNLVTQIFVFISPAIGNRRKNKVLSMAVRAILRAFNRKIIENSFWIWLFLILSFF